MKGVSSKVVCSECNLSLSSEKSEDICCFNCQHTFHSFCLKEKICKICRKPDSLQSLLIIF